MNILKKLKFVRKIQLGFLLLGGISTFIALSDYFHINEMSNSKTDLYEQYTDPKSHIDDLYLEFQKTQFVMLKFSIEEFSSEFKNNIAEYNFHRERIDNLLDSLSEHDINEEVTNQTNRIKEIWKNYKNVVADAIISAAASHTYDMAAVIATTSGEEVGTSIVKDLEEIVQQLEYNSEKLNNNFQKAENDSVLFLFLGMLAGTIIFIFSVFFLAPKISQPIKQIVMLLKEFSLGNYNVEIAEQGDDEFGRLVGMAKDFQKAQIEKIIAAEKIASGDLVKVNEASEKDTLAQAFNKEVTILEELLSELDMLIDANEKGDLSLQLDASKFSGGWARILDGLNKLRSATLAPITEARNVLSQMAEGDFRAKMVGDYKGEYEHIKNDVNKVAVSLNEIIGKVKVSAEELATSAAQISSRTVEMAAGASEQSSQTYEVVSSIEEMTNTITDSTRNATSAATTAQEAGEKAKNGGKVVEETIAGINRIADVVITSANTIEELGKSSDQIGEIIQVINEIADQTNLLALNAAIEAARAGEHGRGFAVVADEVRKLAERTTSATNEITSMIQRIQEDTVGAVDSIEKGKEEVEKGKSLAGDARNALNEIISNTDDVSSLINQLAAASEEQNATSQQIANNVELISNVTQQATDSTEQISMAAENLNRLTDNLQEVVSEFKLDLIQETEVEVEQNLNYNYEKETVLTGVS